MENEHQSEIGPFAQASSLDAAKKAQAEEPSTSQLSSFTKSFARRENPNSRVRRPRLSGPGSPPGFRWAFLSWRSP